MRKHTSAGLCLLLCMILLFCTACGDGTVQTSTATTAAAASSVATTVAATSTPAASAATTAAATAASTSAATTASAADNKALTLPLFDTVRKISLMSFGNDNWRSDNTVLSDIRDHTNIEIEFITFPETAIREKYQTMIATGNLPDLMMGLSDSYNTLDILAKNGIIEPLSDHLDQMPNFSKALDENPLAEDLIKASDGKIYVAFGDGYYAPYGVTSALIYTPDWIEDMGVTFKGDTWEDIYETAKALKTAKPDAYPFLTRGGFDSMIYTMGQQFGTSQGLFYDEKDGTWSFGPTRAGYRDLITYLNKIYTEELLHPEAPTMTSQQYYNIILNEEHVYKGGAFLFEATTWHGTGFNVGTAEAPFYPFALMLPPQGTADGVKKVSSGTEYKTVGEYGHYVNAKTKDMEAVIKWLDYTYSDDGMMFINWGKEGVNYKMITVDGVETPISIQYADKPYDEKDIYSTYVNNTMFGWNFGFYGLGTILPQYNQQYPYLPQDKVDSQQMMLDADAVKWPDPIVWFNDLESAYITTKQEALNTYVKQETAKFIMNQRSLTEWDAFMTELKDMGVEQFIQMYNQAAQRSK